MIKNTLLTMAGFLSFCFFLIYLFPLNALVGQALTDLEAGPLTKANMRLEIGRMDHHLIWGSTFENVKIFKSEKLAFSTSKMAVDFSLWSLLKGDLYFEAHAKIGAGDLLAEIKLGENSLMRLKLDQVALAECPALIEEWESKFLAGQGLSGLISGEGYLAWTSDLKEREGEGEFFISSFKIDRVTLKPLTREWPDVMLSDKTDAFVLQFTVNKNQIRIPKFKMPGPDLIIDSSLEARLGRKGELLRLTFDGKFKLSNRMEELNPELALLESQKGTDGFYMIVMEADARQIKGSVGDLSLGPFDIH